ncbi:MAG: hypothetical protein ACLF0P_13685 [Thermoanaerobaculia bacterium]
MRRHPSDAELARFLRAEDELPRDGWVTDHLLEGCVRCLLALQRLLVEAHREGRQDLRLSAAPGNAREQRRLFRRVVDRLARVSWLQQTEEAVAPALLAELARLPRAERLEIVRQEPRYHLLGFARHLTARCREEAFGDVAQALDLGELAVAAAESLDSRVYLPWGVDEARALAEGALGNANRVARELPAAERWLRLARGHAGAPRGDAMVQAELLSLMGSLRIDQARFRQAEAVLEEALRHARALEGEELRAKLLLQLSHAVGENGRPADAVALLEEAMPLVDAHLPTHLQLRARQNLAWWLVDAGRAQEGEAVYQFIRTPLHDSLQGLKRLHVNWLGARVLRGQGKLDEANEELQQIQEAFGESGAWYDYALVALDRAALLLEQGRTAEVRRLAAEILPAFTSRELHRHALAALALFQRAATAERATAAWVRDLGRYLRHARSDASLRFPGPPDPAAAGGGS